jgi:hypothetical protein
MLMDLTSLHSSAYLNSEKIYKKIIYLRIMKIIFKNKTKIEVCQENIWRDNYSRRNSTNTSIFIYFFKDKCRIVNFRFRGWYDMISNLFPQPVAELFLLKIGLCPPLNLKHNIIRVDYLYLFGNELKTGPPSNTQAFHSYHFFDNFPTVIKKKDYFYIILCVENRTLSLCQIFFKYENYVIAEAPLLPSTVYQWIISDTSFRCNQKFVPFHVCVTLTSEFLLYQICMCNHHLLHFISNKQIINVHIQSSTLYRCMHCTL